MQVIFDHSAPVADNIFSFYFKTHQPLDYTAGQFIELTLPHPNPDQRGIKHWFTLSSSPDEELLAITTKFPTNDMPVSSFKQTLKTLTPGDEVHMSMPMGDFVLPKDKSIPLVFVAGGIGITPMRSMIKWLLDNQQQRTIHLLYAADRIEEIAFRELFNDYGLPTTILLKNPPKNWEGLSGRLNPQIILEQVPDQARQLYFISGPEPMVEQLVEGLAANGVDPRRLVGDYFPNYAKV